jgi:threonine/homoserine/homoserine lactone efflux protein
MDIYGMVALCGAMFILAVSPGPGVFAVVSRALASGFNHASMMIIGIVIGDIIYLLCAIYGLSFIAQFFGNFFIIIKYMGGLYLIYLGYKIFTSKVTQHNIQGIKELSMKVNFLSGLFITLGNPKVIVFYLGFLPAFMDLVNLSKSDILLSIVIVASVLSLVMLSYAYLAARSRKLFKSQKAMEKLNYASGGIMMSVGAVLIVKN